MADVTYADESEIRKWLRNLSVANLLWPISTHARHLTVACWYLCTLPRHQAQERMRCGLQRFIAHHQKQGYHETITRFWMELLCSYLCRCQDGATITSKVNGAIEHFASKDVLYSYYTRDLVMSDAAKAAWIEPDLRTIVERGTAVPRSPFATSKS
jgi:hypothetical protein